MAIRDRVQDIMADLSTAESKVATALLANYPTVGLAPVAEFSQVAGTSAPTVLRFIARLGLGSYPEFQRQLRQELQASLLSPLEKTVERRNGSNLSAFVEAARRNLDTFLEAISDEAFEAAAELLADRRSACYLLGGRFTASLAHYMGAHLQIVRPNVQAFQGQVSNWRDQLLDVRHGDVVVLFDIRRYQRDLLLLAERLAARRARIILMTDTWLSPISRHAKVVLPCAIETGRTWDSGAAMMILCEALVDRVTQRDWSHAKDRIAALEELNWNRDQD